MGMKRKCIGVLIAQPEEVYQKILLQGISEEAFRYGWNVAVFSSLILTGNYEPYLNGEANIFEVANPDLLDGIIIVPDTIGVPFILEKMINDLRSEFFGPIVSVDWDTPYFKSVKGDDRTQIAKLIEHLIEEHDCKDIAFMTGKEGHQHSLRRLEGYMDAMEKHKLEVRKDRIFYGDFWYGKGKEIVETLLKNETGLPDAIACANDQMALSVYDALNARGYKVPDDIKLTGFDCDCVNIDRMHFVTSCKLHCRDTGRRTVAKLYEMIEKQKPLTIPEEPIELLLTPTCGCKIERKPEEIPFNQEKWDSDFTSEYNFMMECLIGAPNIKECLNLISTYSWCLGDFDKMYFCLCDDWQGGSKDQDVEYLFRGYSDRMNMVLTKEYGADRDMEGSIDFDRYFDTSEMIPDLWKESDSPSVFFFVPLHFNERCFGYVVLSSHHSNILLNGTCSPWMRCVNNVMESIRRQENLKHVFEKMEENAVIDMLTGLYNRNGFNLYASGMLQDAYANGKQVLIMMGDLNGLKYINDNFGHLCGDNAIKVAATMLNNLKIESTVSEKNFRIGGDEFVKICVGTYNEDEVKANLNMMKENMKGYNAISGNEYPVYLSVGFVCTRIQRKQTIDRLMTIADERMFIEKEIMRRETGFNPGRNSN